MSLITVIYPDASPLLLKIVFWGSLALFIILIGAAGYITFGREEGQLRRSRHAVVFIIMFLLSLCIAASMRWFISERIADTKKKTASEVKIKTLQELLASDFPRALQFQSERTTKTDDGTTIKFHATVFKDLEAKVEFIGFYIPWSKYSFAVCKLLSKDYKNIMNEMKSIIVTDPTIQTSSRELMFSGRIFIYHENPFSLQEMAALERDFQTQGLSVVFRGQEYRIKKSLSEDNSTAKKESNTEPPTKPTEILTTQPTPVELAKEVVKEQQRQFESQKKNQKAIIEKNIDLSVNYPLNCWAAAIPGQLRYPRIINGETMTAPFEKRDDYCLAVRICNDNDDIPLDQAQILIRLSPDISVRPAASWPYNLDNNKRDLFSRDFGSVIKGTCLGPDDMLKLGFPKPGMYQVDYRISGIAQGITINVEGKFYIKLLQAK